MRCGRELWSVSVRDYRLLIFDWDGTLVDSIGRIVAAMHMAADACDLPRCTDEQVRALLAWVCLRPFAACIRICMMRLVRSSCGTVTAKTIWLLRRSLRHCFTVWLRGWRRFVPRAIVWRLRPAKGGHGLQRVLAGRGWLDYFDYSRCADEAASKPDPLMLHEILAQSGVTASQAFDGWRLVLRSVDGAARGDGLCCGRLWCAAFAGVTRVSANVGNRVFYRVARLVGSACV